MSKKKVEKDLEFLRGLFLDGKIDRKVMSDLIDYFINENGRVKNKTNKK